MRIVPISELHTGDIICKTITDQYEHILVRAGVEIKNEKMIERLHELGVASVFIEDNWSADIFIQPVIDEKLANQTMDALANMDVDRVLNCASEIVDVLLASSELCNDIETVLDYDEYTYTHCINVAVASATLGIGLGYSYDRLRNLTAGALLHDVGKQLVPIDIINKKGKLTDEEMAIVKKHPTDGYNILSQNVLITSAMREIAHQHHENWDGTGYPRGLREKNIYDLANLVHICDVWDALLSKRSYKEAFHVSEAVAILKKGLGTQFNPTLLNAFFKYVPIYHKGTKVSTNLGRDALIYENHRGRMLYPTLLFEDGTTMELSEDSLFCIE